jgi:hypothetical protein
MRSHFRLRLLLAAIAAFAGAQASARPDPAPFAPADLFELEWADSPMISNDGRAIVFSRVGFDRSKDRRTSALWTVRVADGALRPLGPAAALPRARVSTHATRSAPYGRPEHARRNRRGY